ncbi:hypothetical protein VPHK460_0038 [Vibrio phage K460]
MLNRVNDLILGHYETDTNILKINSKIKLEDKE